MGPVPAHWVKWGQDPRIPSMRRNPTVPSSLSEASPPLRDFGPSFSPHVRMMESNGCGYNIQLVTPRNNSDSDRSCSLEDTRHALASLLHFWEQSQALGRCESYDQERDHPQRNC